MAKAAPRILASSELRGRYGDVELLNNSAEPVTEVLVFLSRVSYKVQRWWDQEPEYRVMIGVLPPGRWTISVPKRAALSWMSNWGN